MPVRMRPVRRSSDASANLFPDESEGWTVERPDPDSEDSEDFGWLSTTKNPDGGSLDIQLNNDDVVDGDEIFTLELVPPKDKLRFTEATYTASESDESATVTLTKSGKYSKATFIIENDDLPENDDFADSFLLNDESFPVSYANFDATKEQDEPDHASNSGGASVWWFWTPSEAGEVTITTTGSDFDTLLGVYTGTSLSDLTTVMSNDDFGSSAQSQVTFAPVVGTTYYIAVDGYNNGDSLEIGNIQLSLEQSITGNSTDTPVAIPDGSTIPFSDVGLAVTEPA